MRSHANRLRAAVAAALAVGALGAFGASSASANDFWLNASHTVPTTHCYTGLAFTDLLQTAPTAANSTTFGGNTLMGCSNAVQTQSTLAAGTQGTVDLWFTNTNKKPCQTDWFLAHNANPNGTAYAPTSIVGSGASYGNGPYIYVPANTKTPYEEKLNFTVPSDTTLPAGDQLTLWVDVRTASGSCSNMTLYYGSATNPGTATPATPSLSLPTAALPITG